ncbi:MAG: glycosyltransferase family 39 protein [Acidobacteria bacterium]|nr:glycosyltransferase family 39 protein [Acidobacteriota bacterium]
MNDRGKIGTAGIIFLLAAYVVLRFWRLEDSCLWFDEIFSVHAASMPWSGILGFVAQDLIHPPLFYVLLKLWTSVGGESLRWVRLFPFLFSIASLVPFCFLARDLKLRSSQTLLALLFLAVNGGLIKYAQEVRMYSVVLMLALFSVWLFVRFLYLGKNIWLLTIVNVLLVYTHYFGGLLILAEILVIVVQQRIKIRQTLIMTGIVSAAFAPWLIAVYVAAANSTGLAQNIGWINAPGAVDAFNFGFDLVDPFYSQASSIDPASMYVFSLPILLIVFASGIVYFADWKTRDERQRSNVVLLLIIAVFPILAAFIASWLFPYSIWGTRHLIFVFAPLAVAGSIALTEIGSRVFRLSAITLLSTAIGFALLSYALRPPQSFIWCGWENLAREVDMSRPAKIYAFEDVVAYDLWFALRNSPAVEIFKVNGVEGLVEDKAYFIPRGFSAIGVTDEQGITGERFYVAFRDSAWNEKHAPLRNLRSAGYSIGEPKVFEAQGIKAFLVEVNQPGR